MKDGEKLYEVLVEHVFKGAPVETLEPLIDEYASNPEERRRGEDILEDVRVEYLLAMQERTKARDRLLAAAFYTAICVAFCIYMQFAIGGISIWLLFLTIFGAMATVRFMRQLRHPLEYFVKRNSHDFSRPRIQRRL